MHTFDKLFKKLLIHEAFDKVYPLKDKFKKRSVEDIDTELEGIVGDEDDTERRKQYAYDRMPFWDRETMRDQIQNRQMGRREDLRSERKVAKSQNERNEKNEQIVNQIVSEALKRTGSPKKEIIELQSVQNFIHTFVDVYHNRKIMEDWREEFGRYGREEIEENPEYPDLDYISFNAIKQSFDAKAGSLEINISPMISTTEEFDLEKSNGMLDIAFSSKEGYDVVTGGGDAAQVIATVMEFAFAVFCVYEAAIKLLFPVYYQWKRESYPKMIKFSPVDNYQSDMNMKSKLAKEGQNKRARIYTLGWERSMRKRVPDLELSSEGGSSFPRIFIMYK